ncbi:hypothetical protein A6P54_18660 [Bacillus sp. MKU004]|nr:hypothetical protein A6P54_18660 [Bacillus sp. MKU004]
MQSKLVVIILLCSVLVSINAAQVICASPDYFYPDNCDKELNASSASDYYSSHPALEYKELDHADIAIREKTLYRDTFNIVDQELKGHKHLLWEYKKNKLENVSPKRQVYFYYSVTINKKNKYHTRKAIVDIETGNEIVVGESIDY